MRLLYSSSRNVCKYRGRDSSPCMQREAVCTRRSWRLIWARNDNARIFCVIPSAIALQDNCVQKAPDGRHREESRTRRRPYLVRTSRENQTSLPEATYLAEGQNDAVRSGGGEDFRSFAAASRAAGVNSNSIRRFTLRAG